MGMEFKPRWISFAVVAAFAFALPAVNAGLAPARAQLLLPGATSQAQPPAAAQASPSPAPAPAPAPPNKPKPAPPKPPPIKSILGRELSLNGSEGAIRFQAAPRKGDREIEITKLSLAGEETTDSPGPCLVNVVTEEPIRAKFAGRPNGLSRFDVDIKACPFSFEILDGAILVSRTPPACEFAAAQCRANLAGLWGPPGKSFGPDQAKRLEHERGRAETEMRNKFRALMAKAGKDKEAVKKIASEQAGFSSARETACRNYAGEDARGFCALRLTQARIAALQAALAGPGLRTKAASGSAKQEKKKTTEKRKPAPDSGSAPAQNTEAAPAPPPGDTPRQPNIVPAPQNPALAPFRREN